MPGTAGQVKVQAMVTPRGPHSSSRWAVQRAVASAASQAPLRRGKPQPLSFSVAARQKTGRGAR